MAGSKLGLFPHPLAPSPRPPALSPASSVPEAPREERRGAWWCVWNMEPGARNVEPGTWRGHARSEPADASTFVLWLRVLTFFFLSFFVVLLSFNWTKLWRFV